MLTPRAGAFGLLLAGWCGLTAGCQSAPKVGALQPRTPADAPMAKAPAGQGQIFLRPGMEVQWQAQTAYEQPGQVKHGTGLVGPDGAVEVGPYGSCKVAGLNLTQATMAIEKHLAVYMKTPSVSLSTTLPESQAPMADRRVHFQEQSVPTRFTSTPTVPAQQSFVDNAVQPVVWRTAGSASVPVEPKTQRVEMLIDNGKETYVTTDGGVQNFVPTDAGASQGVPGNRSQSERSRPLGGAFARMVAPLERLFSRPDSQSVSSR